MYQVPGDHQQEASPRWVGWGLAQPLLVPWHAHQPAPNLNTYYCRFPLTHPTDGSEVVNAIQVPGPPRQLVEELQSRYRQMEERITCPICIDSHIRLVFQCGHGACAPCGAALNACPICRQPIRDRIQIFV